jgi:hypothetical protein
MSAAHKGSCDGPKCVVFGQFFCRRERRTCDFDIQSAHAEAPLVLRGPRAPSCAALVVCVGTKKCDHTWLPLRWPVTQGRADNYLTEGYLDTSGETFGRQTHAAQVLVATRAYTNVADNAAI